MEYIPSAEIWYRKVRDKTFYNGKLLHCTQYVPSAQVCCRNETSELEHKKSHVSHTFKQTFCNRNVHGCMQGSPVCTSRVQTKYSWPKKVCKHFLLSLVIVNSMCLKRQLMKTNLPMLSYKMELMVQLRTFATQSTVNFNHTIFNDTSLPSICSAAHEVCFNFRFFPKPRGPECLWIWRSTRRRGIPQKICHTTECKNARSAQRGKEPRNSALSAMWPCAA